jgi:bla regulator protein blaR1
MRLSITMLPQWTEMLGWTLLNSIWQAVLVMLLVIFVLRILPQRFSKMRYAIACASIVIVFISSVATFVILQSNQDQQPSHEVAYFFASASDSPASDNSKSPQSLIKQNFVEAITLIDNNMSLILLAWSLGAVLFSLRLVSGWWFISTLKSNATILSNRWTEKLQTLAASLGMTKIIQLAESTRITTPMVIGFFKPIVLVPAGMLAGLSSSQIQTIFLHELAHIRRHDYLINLVQVFVETIFFFNPFVWILSSIVRREREYCCDDDVVSIHGSSLEYAKALAQLEEWKLTKSTFGLALAANKNQLLHRIKRIMEKTGEKYSAKDRFVPAVLLIVGLICASWLTVQKNQHSSQKENFSDAKLIATQDTTKKGKSSRTTIITIDENGKAHEQIFEEVEGETDLAFWMPAPPTPSVDFAIPAIAPVPAIPAFPSFDAFPAMPADVWAPAHFPDTIPGAWFKGSHNWEQFSKEFEKKFSEEFSDFYKKHEKDFDKMMKEMEKKFKAEFDAGDFHGLQLLDAQRLHELAAVESLNLDRQHLDEMHLAQEQALAALEHVQEMPALAGLEAMSADLAGLQVNLNHLNGQMEEFNKGLTKMLIEDGYLKKGEELKSINWDNNNIEINGKKIKEADRKKYQEHHEKYWNFVPNRIE